VVARRDGEHHVVIGSREEDATITWSRARTPTISAAAPQPLREIGVLGARARVAARMVVREHHRVRALADRGSERVAR
jgi:hypothetical protein